jgi:hypothetical protein
MQVVVVAIVIGRGADSRSTPVVVRLLISRLLDHPNHFLSLLHRKQLGLLLLRVVSTHTYAMKRHGFSSVWARCACPFLGCLHSRAQRPARPQLW